MDLAALKTSLTIAADRLSEMSAYATPDTTPAADCAIAAEAVAAAIGQVDAEVARLAEEARAAAEAAG